MGARGKVEEADQDLGRLGAGDHVLVVEHEHRHAAHAQALGPAMRRDHLAPQPIAGKEG
jgi:hypothetical protein